MQPRRTIRELLEDALWWLRHPSTRRCPRCNLTWESRRVMRTQGGVCHDCWGEEIDNLEHLGSNR